MLVKQKIIFPCRFVAINAFSNIIKEKSDSNGGKRWLFKKINLPGEGTILARVFIGLFFVFTELLTVVFSIFWSRLLIEISHSCDEDHAKDCFEHSISKRRDTFTDDPVDCYNPAITNGTMDVVCYKLFLDAGGAFGAGYGTFKISMFLINAAAAGMLMVKATTIKRIREGVTVISCAVIGTLLIIQVYKSHNFLIYVIQATILLITAIMFVWIIPWIDLLVIRQRQNNPEATSDEAALDHDNVL